MRREGKTEYRIHASSLNLIQKKKKPQITQITQIIGSWLLPVFLLLGAQAAPAQERAALKAQLRPLALRSRSCSPMPVEVTFTWEGRQLLEGCLDIVFRSGNEVVGRYMSADLALTTGKQSFRMLLPPVHAEGYNSQVQVRMRFLSADSVINLREHVMFCPNTSERSLVICVGRPPRDPGKQLHLTLRSMQLERLNPDKADRTSPTLDTFLAHVAPEDLPAIPIGYCCYDMVFLGHDGFTLLRGKQLKALGRWVEAGGSACVIPGGGLKQHHVDFLNNLSGSTREEPDFSLDFEGRLEEAPALADKRVCRFHAGLGRLVVLFEPPQESADFDSPEWREALAFLWKVRARHLAHITSDGKWSKEYIKTLTPEDYYDDYGRYDDSYQGNLEFHVMPAPIGGELLDTLLPQSVSLIPFWAIVLVLVLFVVVVGPVDYFVLGLLRQRRLTWVVFPAVSIGLTLFTVYLSESYMGQSDRRNSVTFVDLGRGGRVLRTSSFEVIFTVRHKDIVNEVRGALFCPMSHSSFRGGYGQWDYDRRYQSSEGAPPCYVGRIPEHFSVAQSIEQWTPQLNRYFSMKPVQASIKLNWDAIDPASFKHPEGRESLKSRILGNENVDAHICIFNLDQTYHAAGHRAIFPRDVLQQTCARTPRGLFAVVSQISPNGASNFEDLTILDTTDPDQWLLVVTVREGANFTVYRRLFHGDK